MPIVSLQEAGNVTIVLRKSWIRIFEAYSFPTMRFVEDAMNHGLDVCDVMGIRFQDLVISMLTKRKTTDCWEAFDWDRKHRYF